MKKSNAFVQPQRQSIWAIIFIVLKYLRKLVGQIWPILLAFFLGKSNNRFDTFELLLSGLGIFGMVSSIISYFRYYYYIAEGELVIESGIFKKVKLNLPFERIQSINFNQSVLHQVLGVTAVDIESAGSDQKEMQIDALDMETANALRTLLLQKRAIAISNMDDDSTLDGSESINVMEEEEVVLQLDTKDLIRVGLAQNHLKPIGLIFSLLGSIFVYGYTLDLDPIDIFKELIGNLNSFTLLEEVLWILILIPLMVLYSIVTTVLRHYKLKFWRSGNRFHVTEGLFNKRQFSALDRKIQVLSWGQNPFERMLGFFRISFRQARSGNKKSEKMQISIPGCDAVRVEYVKDSWLGKASGQFDETFPVSFHYFRRSAIYSSVFFAVLLTVFIFFKVGPGCILVPFIWILSIYLQWKEYKKKKYGFNGKEVYIGGGMLGFKHSILPVYKVQNLKIMQNAYQWRRDLATLVIFTAGGAVSIPYISHTNAKGLLDKLVCAVETSRKSWM
jgi:putative membrane protein